jgi:uncharacterized protein YndB with AHSA1/START domain
MSHEPQAGAPVARAEMLIHKPVDAVFEAFVNPDITTKFWFTHSTGRLCEAQRVTWTWGMFGFSADVRVLELEQDRRILLEWGAADEKPTLAEWKFTPRDGATYVAVINHGFGGDASRRAAAAIESTEGFALVLVGAKAWLEHELRLNLIVDRFPDAVNSAPRVE